MSKEKIIILDFGGQYKELIARRVRELNVFAEIWPGNVSSQRVKDANPSGLIFTGGPDSVYGENAPTIDAEILKLGIPILGICYGMQLIAYTLGGKVAPCGFREYGQVKISVNNQAPLFVGQPEEQLVLMSHTDQVVELPPDFEKIASSTNCKNAAIKNAQNTIYAIQFHPEVVHSEYGQEIFHNFVYDICHCTGDYNMEDYIENQVKLIRQQVGDEKVLLALSGGVDSAVTAALLSKAIPNKVVCIFVDHGLMRKNEPQQVEDAFANKELTFVRVDASKRFLKKLEGVTDPETKRKIIGAEFIEVFKEQAAIFGKDVKFLAQGTIYPDVIESGTNSAKIKSHHNVGGLPKELGFEGLVEPLRSLFKDEVRKVGTKLGLPDHIVHRQPFPGPGLAVRCLGEITEAKLNILRDADAIWREELEKANVKADQYFAVLTNIKSVGVMGDDRTYDYTIALRAVSTTDFMTCEYVRVPYEVLDVTSKRITNEVKGVNRVVYDITGKPPATIEFE